MTTNVRPKKRSVGVVIDPAAHLDWAAGVARLVARRYRFGPGSQEEADLAQVAALTVARKAPAYDPAGCPPGGDHGGRFRGWVYLHVRSECVREARRLRNGGGYRSRREEAGVALVAAPFSDLDTPAGGAFDVPADRGGEPDPEPDPPPEPDPRPLAARGLYGRRLARGY